MGLFKSKQEKEFKRKQAQIKFVNALTKRIKDLDKQKEEYVAAVRIALKEGIPDQVELAKSALRLTLAWRKKAYRELLNVKILSQMLDQQKSETEFVKVIRSVTSDIIGVKAANAEKVKTQLASAMDKIKVQTEILSDLMDSGQTEITGLSDADDTVLDAEVNRVIYGTASPSGKNSSRDIEDDIKALRDKLGQI